MKGINLAILLLAVGLVLFTIVYNVRKRMKGESACGYCSGCVPDGAKHAHGKDKGCCAAKGEK